MTPSDEARWDAKYAGRLGRRWADPDAFVLQALAFLGVGAGRRALDLASGSGRHAIELARRGWKTSAWDVSGVGLGLLVERARQAGLGLQTRRLDLLGMDSPQEHFELVLSCDFLDRPLWRRLARWVRPGGHVLLVTFTQDWPGDKPPAAYRLQRGELADGLPGFSTELLFERSGRAGILARRMD